MTLHADRDLGPLRDQRSKDSFPPHRGYLDPNPDVEGSCPCCAGLASLARVPNPDRREESHVGATSIPPLDFPIFSFIYPQGHIVIALTWLYLPLIGLNCHNFTYYSISLLYAIFTLHRYSSSETAHTCTYVQTSY